MATGDFAWIYLLFFLIIPLSRIIPRLLKKKGMKNFSPSQFLGGQFEQSSAVATQEHTPAPSKPQTTDMMVLGEINRGTKTFADIKKNTGIDTNNLNSILEGLEKRGLMVVEQKQGLFGPKVELYATKKGRQEYYS